VDGSIEPENAATGAIAWAMAEARDAHQAIWDSFGRVERIMLVALADGQAAVGSRVAAEHRSARSTLQGALERLFADERHVQRNDRGEPYLLDPLFAEWLRRR
jgi:hypothetical protein